jgi:hypothetical protein
MEAVFIFVSDWKKPVPDGFKNLGEKVDQRHDQRGRVELDSPMVRQRHYNLLAWSLSRNMGGYESSEAIEGRCVSRGHIGTTRGGPR